MTDKSQQTVRIFNTDLPRWQDCTRCGKPLACPFDRVAYLQPCEECRESDEYKAEQKKKGNLSWKHGNPLKNREITGVFEGKGTRFFTNHKGDVVRTEPLNKPIESGKKDWK